MKTIAMLAACFTLLSSAALMAQRTPCGPREKGLEVIERWGEQLQYSETSPSGEGFNAATPSGLPV